MSSIKLISGHAMPLLGLGTWQMRGQQCSEIVQMALDMGYRHVDTAYMYANQVEVGAGLRASSVATDEVFVTTKIWHDSLAYDQVHQQFDECLEMLALDYVDLLLIHHPNEDVPLEETLGAFDEIAISGRARSIGVSNFSPAQVDAARAVASAPIVNNQVELHVGCCDVNFLKHSQRAGVTVTAHRPLARGDLADADALADIGAAHGKTAAQVALRWVVQKGIIAIPKASSEQHLRANMEIWDWVLSDGEMGWLNEV